MSIDNYDFKHVVRPREIFHSIWRQSETETKVLQDVLKSGKVTSVFHRRKSRIQRCRSLHRLFFAIGQRQITWIEKCKGPLERKRNRQSEAEARRDVGALWRKLLKNCLRNVGTLTPAECINSLLLPVAKESQRQNSDASDVNANMVCALRVSGLSKHIIESDFQRRILYQNAL